MNRLRSAMRDLDPGTLRNVGLIILAVLGASAIFWFSGSLIGLDRHGMLSQIFSDFASSSWALPVVIAAFTVTSFAGAPQFILIAIAVAAFGPVTGFIYSYVATLISALINFQAARWLGAEWLQRRGWATLDNISDRVSRNGFFASMVVRVLPSAPFVVVNMALGLTQTTVWEFLAGTAVGSIPKTAVIALLGKVVERAQDGDALAIFYLALATAAWIAIAVLARQLIRLRHARRR